MNTAASFIARLLQRAAPAAEATAPTARAGQSSPAPAPATPALQGLGPDLVLEEQLSTAHLLALYKRAFMDVQSVEGRDRLRVATESGVRLLVGVDASRRLVFFSAYFGLKEHAALADKLAFAHRANDKLVLARYTVLDDTTLYADYQLPYEGGLPAALLVGLTRRLGSTMAQAMADLDSDQVLG